MLTAFAWLLFAMAIWGLCILMQALENRFATTGPKGQKSSWWQSLCGGEQTTDTMWDTPSQTEIAELKKRIEVLEAIVTDRRYRFDEALWDEELRRS